MIILSFTDTVPILSPVLVMEKIALYLSSNYVTVYGCLCGIPSTRMRCLTAQGSGVGGGFSCEWSFKSSTV